MNHVNPSNGIGEELRIKKIVFDHSERLSVASFESLGVPQAENFASSTADLFGIKEGILNPNEETRMKRILAMDVPIEGNKSFRYEGSTPYDSEDSYVTFAAVVDEATGEATLYPADVYHMMPRSGGYGDHPWRLRMDIPNHKESVKAEKALKDVGAEKNSADGSKDKSNAVDVSHSFGTSAKQRRKKQMGLNRNIITPTDGQELDQIVEGAPTEEKVQKVNIPGDDSGILPPMNINNPDTPRDVLNEDDLLPPRLAQLILSIPDVQKIIQKDVSHIDEWTNSKAFPSWFLNAIKSFSLDEERRQRQVKLSYFALALYNLAKSKSDAIRKKNASLPESWPSALIIHLCDNFTQMNINSGKKNRVMPTVLKDKALLYAMYTLLLANDFCFPAGEFFSELSLVTESRIQSLCALGRLTYYSMEGAKWIDLRTPLPEFQGNKDKEKSRKRRL